MVSRFIESQRIYIKDEGIFVDIRPVNSFIEEHVPNSINSPLTELPQKTLENSKLLPKDRAIYIVCCAKDRNALWAVLP